MLSRYRLWPGIASDLLASPDRLAHGLLVRDLNGWIRLEFLGVTVRAGIAQAMDRPSTADEIAQRAGLADRDLLEAFLRLGVSLGELSEQRGRYRVRGRRMRAVSDGRSVDLRGILQELIVYDSPIYTAMERHLRGEPAQPYDENHGRVIAEASRVAEPLLAPALRGLVRDIQPERVLDIGCGSGIYLRHVLQAAPTAKAVGIDSDPAAAEIARTELQEFRSLGRCEIREADITTSTADMGTFDLVLLLNNIYYWEPQDRTDLLRNVSKLLTPGGWLIVASAIPSRSPFNRHLDVMLRVTSGSYPLPTVEELERQLGEAGLQEVTVIEPIPQVGLALAAGTRP